MCFVYLFIVYFTVCRYKCEFLCDFYDPHFPLQLDFIKIERNVEQGKDVRRFSKTFNVHIMKWFLMNIYQCNVKNIIPIFFQKNMLMDGIFFCEVNP